MQQNKTGLGGDFLLTYVVAGIGFGCLIGWELSGVFSPSLILLGCYSITEAVALRIISLITLLIAFAVCILRADQVLANKNKLLISTAFLALPAVVNAIVCAYSGPTPLAVAAPLWALFGIAQGAISTYWCIFYSLLPTPRTPLSIGLGAVLGTGLFVFVNTPGVMAVSLFELAVIIVLSIFIPYLLTRHMPDGWALPPRDYRKARTITFPAALSSGCFGAVYGFMSITVCTLGEMGALIGGASGIVGTAVACVWGYLGPKVEIDSGMVQRGSLPILLGGLLLFPLSGYWGQIVCCGFVITALAHQTIMKFAATCTDNKEFRLHPVERYGLGSVPTYIGFSLGAVFSYLIMVKFPLSGNELLLALVIFSLVVVVSFVIYGANETETRQRLNELLDTAAASVAVLPQKADEADNANDKINVFRTRCTEVIAEYHLTPREAEVFRLLAKGRNAEYIARNLVVSPATVKSHIYHIYRKLDVRSQQHLMNIVDDEMPE